MPGLNWLYCNIADKAVVGSRISTVPASSSGVSNGIALNLRVPNIEGSCLIRRFVFFTAAQSLPEPAGSGIPKAGETCRVRHNMEGAVGGNSTGVLSAKTPADFLKSIRGRPVVVKLNSGVDYRGILACLDGYMNIAMEQTEEYVNGQLKNKYGDAFIRGVGGSQNIFQSLDFLFQLSIQNRNLCLQVCKHSQLLDLLAEREMDGT
ncbi:hypothetical protein R1flu_003736 [Riccia fluitans]|uniref:Sm domain-containing protein n=1 Tax=Riccia fluitans TaxID=41844 RepID=A0ABD1Y9W7_9MARC